MYRAGTHHERYGRVKRVQGLWTSGGRPVPAVDELPVVRRAAEADAAASSRQLTTLQALRYADGRVSTELRYRALMTSACGGSTETQQHRA